MGNVQTAAGKILNLSTHRAHHVMETGDDLRAKQYSIRRPFKTIQACFDDVYEDGDIIIIWPGVYDYEDSIVFTTKVGTVSNVYLYYHENAIITVAADDTPYIVAPAVAVNYHIDGRGQFNHTGEFASITDTAIFGSSTGIVFIHGAKSIVCAEGIPQGNSWGNIENVDLIESGNSYAIYASVVNPFAPRNGRDIGVLRNLKLVRGFEGGFGLTNPSSEHILAENCNFEALAGGTYAGYTDGDGHRATWINCTFKNDSGRCVYVKGYERFINCKFQNGHATLECVKVDDTGISQDYNNYRPVFDNCWFRGDGGGVAILTQGPAMFAGVNRAYGETQPYHAVQGFQESENVIHGVLIVNDTTAGAAAQMWQFILGTDPPTVGEIYTITAPDTTTVSYTVVALDTRTIVANALAANWATQAAADPTGDFAKYTPLALTGPTYGVQATAIDPDDNFDPEAGFVPSVSGTDSFTSIYPLTDGFSWKGTGNFEVDEELMVGEL